MKIERSWHTNRDRLVLRMDALIEGRVLSVSALMNEMWPGGPPPAYIEQDLKRRLMRAIEDELFKEDR